MRIFLKVIWVLTILLSIATGLFKLLEQEADVVLFEKIGFTPFMTMLFGGLQLVGGVLLIFKQSRVIGAFIMILTFSIASIAVFANKMYPFGIVSLIFIAMAYSVLYKERHYE